MATLVVLVLLLDVVSMLYVVLLVNSTVSLHLPKTVCYNSS